VGVIENGDRDFGKIEKTLMEKEGNLMVLNGLGDTGEWKIFWSLRMSV
jgi:hypothetical protein